MNEDTRKKLHRMIHCLRLELPCTVANEVLPELHKVVDDVICLTAERDAAWRENDILRGVIAKSPEPCVHCGLTDKSRCPSGFPGCAWADDLLAGEDEGFRAAIEQRDAARRDADSRLTKEQVMKAVEVGLSSTVFGDRFYDASDAIATQIDALTPPGAEPEKEIPSSE